MNEETIPFLKPNYDLKFIYRCTRLEGAKVFDWREILYLVLLHQCVHLIFQLSPSTRQPTLRLGFVRFEGMKSQVPLPLRPFEGYNQNLG